ncbi:unnamed protein product [Bursaphelenchus okinawaensis]|uniref:Sterol regulatory element-binding protein cleavage-activating protein n=1 Tax=Bursaphelenchus okinawaensis TaxID=465554 RepID=A0A811K741_9BILA|nr:unnamed protein product [Bursaphelenchus okinawaensis]CAG9094612.1 unnamed protein product [Bursaphelenchus okinawaensis]
MWKLFSEKVHRTFFDYGKLCSAHPVACLSLSLLSVVFLSYPAMLKIELPVSSPFDVYWHQTTDSLEDAPEWLSTSPDLIIQQIVVSTQVDPWNTTEFTPDTVHLFGIPESDENIRQIGKEVYFYYTVKKFEMVKSKFGLAIASFFTVVFTLTTTLGICQHLDYSASMGRSKIFPYLAMIVGLENVLCITRSVVSIPPSLDVSVRIAHGLSEEAPKITKYFVLEMFFLLFGYLTQVPEIQEFCVFAFIGIVVDMYMQLFFYTPCLIFDLNRMDSADKNRFSIMLFNTDIKKLKKFPNPKCPAEHLFPSLFKRKNRLLRRLSEDNLKNEGSKKGHKRSTSSVNRKGPVTPQQLFSNRLQVLHYWTKTRIVQRVVMFSFLLWVGWLAFLVQKWRVFEGLFGEAGNFTFRSDSKWMSHHILDTAPLEWSVWSTATFKWWPLLLEQYHLSLSARYVTFMPLILLQDKISYDAREFNVEFKGVYSNVNAQLQDRIDWLELEMSRWLLISAVLPFLTVTMFILYMCFWERWLMWKKELQSAFTLKRSNFRSRLSSVELTPLAFSRHELPIECVAAFGDIIVSASVNGQVFVWDGKSGELKNSLLRNRNTVGARARSRSFFVPNEPKVPSSNDSSRNKSLVWCLDVSDRYIVLGCSDGEIQLASVSNGTILYSKTNDTLGVSHIQIANNRIVAVRLNGIVEVLEIASFTNDFGESKVILNHLSKSYAHHKPVTNVICTISHIITASYDNSIRVIDQESLHLSNSLYGHNGAVISICNDEEHNMLFSSCDRGRICCWDILTGRLLRSLEKDDHLPVEIVCTSKYLVGFSTDAGLWIWDKMDGDLVCNLLVQEHTDPLTLLLDIDENVEPILREGRFLVKINDRFVCTSDVNSAQVWDLEAKSVVKQIRLPAPIDSLQQLDDKSILCCVGTELYRISAPLHQS